MKATIPGTHGIKSSQSVTLKNMCDITNVWSSQHQERTRTYFFAFFVRKKLDGLKINGGAKKMRKYCHKVIQCQKIYAIECRRRRRCCCCCCCCCCYFCCCFCKSTGKSGFWFQTIFAANPVRK